MQWSQEAEFVESGPLDQRRGFAENIRQKILLTDAQVKKIFLDLLEKIRSILEKCRAVGFEVGYDLRISRQADYGRDIRTEGFISSFEFVTHLLDFVENDGGIRLTMLFQCGSKMRQSFN